MANPEWAAIFRNFTPDELAAQITELKKQISVYSAQSVGNKSYTKDLAELRGQLSAAYLVQQERSNRRDPGYGVTDFSRI